jgi:hypothetical protein
MRITPLRLFFRAALQFKSDQSVGQSRVSRPGYVPGALMSLCDVVLNNSRQDRPGGIAWIAILIT